jgi:DNA-binding MarR family transcriptional regulator
MKQSVDDTDQARSGLADAPRTPIDGRTSAPDVGILAGRLLFAFQRELFARLAAQGHPDIRPRHGAILAHIDPAGTRATDFAARSGVHKVIIGRMIDELEALGYVTREPDPADRRAKLIVPTPRGLDQMRRARTIHDDMERAYRDALGTRKWDTLVSSLTQLADIATEHASKNEQPDK